jgi:hypothetical protein
MRKKILSFIKCLISICIWIIDKIILEIVLWTIINSIFFTLFILNCIKTIWIKILNSLTHSCCDKSQPQMEKLDSDNGKSNT